MVIESQDSLLRAAVLSRLVDLNADDVLAEARSRFGLHVSGAKAISPDLRTAVYKAVALEGESGFDALLKVCSMQKFTSSFLLWWN